MNFLNTFLCFSEQNEQKIDFVRFLTKIYLILSFNLDMELIFGFEKRDFSILPAAKIVI